jgi:hypothetical protein
MMKDRSILDFGFRISAQRGKLLNTFEEFHVSGGFDLTGGAIAKGEGFGRKT